MLDTEEPTIPLHAEDILPPWGDLDTGGKSTLASTALPLHWSFELDDTERERQFVRWWFHTLRSITRHLWPRYDRERRAWAGESVRFMTKLTEADLHLMLQIQHPHRGGRQFEKPPTSGLRPPGTVTHRHLFRLEDQNDGANMFDNYGVYNRNVDSTTLAAISNLCWAGDDTKQTPVAYLFKRVLERPRPMQMALRFGHHNFNYENATSSLTPSMCSGHCIQSLLSVGTVIERFLGDGLLTADLISTLPQWAVDIGDRRVLAGVHYPTDSLCSWVIFLQMADFVYDQPHAIEVKRLLGDAITTKSYIYQKIVEFARTAEGAIYQEPLDLLRSSFDPGPIPDIDPPCAPKDF